MKLRFPTGNKGVLKRQLTDSAATDPLGFPLIKFNRAERRALEADYRSKPDVHARRKCSGRSQLLPEEGNGYLVVERQRKVAKAVARREREERAANRRLAARGW